MQVIESKIEGRETVEVEETPEPTKLVDLMAALQASVSAATSARDAKGKPVSAFVDHYAHATDRQLRRRRLAWFLEYGCSFDRPAVLLDHDARCGLKDDAPAIHCETA